MDSFAEFVKEKRKELGLSIRKLAEAAEISHTEIKRIEDGIRTKPSPDILRRIATALSVPYEELMHTAGYIDGVDSGSTAVAGIQAAEDLTEEELAQVNMYIQFLKSQRKS